MKNIRKYGLMLLLGLASCGAWSCSADKTDEKFTPKDPEMTFGDGKPFSVVKAGGEFKVDIKSNLPWRVYTDAAWIIMGDTENGMSDGVISFTVKRNATLKARVAVITAYITSDYKKTLIVSQEPSQKEDLLDYYVKTDGDPEADGISWQTATTFAKALENSISGGSIYVAAGTYVPTVGLAGSTVAGSETFEIGANLTIIGGYPADAKDNTAQSDPALNPTILSGVLPSGKYAAHVMSITAPKESDKQVVIQGFQLRDGTYGGGADVTVNGVVVKRSTGSGLVVANANATLTDCIVGPSAPGEPNAPGASVIGGANVFFDRCTFTKNVTTSGNCGGLWNDASTVTLDQCVFSDNSCEGVGGAIYAYNSSTPSYTYCYNSLFINNTALNKGVASRRGSAFYGRENSVSVFVNCTFTGNKGGNGTAVSAYTSAKVDLVSCTITNNPFSVKDGGAVESWKGATINVYNSIVSGNKMSDDSQEVNYVSTDSPVVKPVLNYSTDGTTIYGERVTVPGQSFDYKTMLGPLADNGGPTKTIQLIGTDNPARTLGMTTILLSSLGSSYAPAISDEIMLKDQTGATRTGSVIGACVK